MSGYEVAFYPDALKDIKRLDGSQRKIVLKAIEKNQNEPIAAERGWIWQASWKQGGYGFDWLYENQAQGKWHSNRVPSHQN